ncbi:MAG: choline-sulfatase [Acidimicrobiales bacterium]|nr:choline-sulfatase [Acidimicrobiales bacterium]
MKQPNILVVMADQLPPHFTGAYGHPVVQTPNIDLLAARGMRFDAAYCNSPLCAPARAAFLTGQAITRIGAWDNAAEFAASVPTFAHHLRLMGYRTCLSGKMHFIGPDQLHGFERRLTTDIYPADFAWTPNWDRPDERIARWYHGMDSLLEAGQATMTYQIEYDDEVGFTACRRLFDLARTPGRPFMLVASFIHPHDPYVARPEWWDLYDHDTIDLPAEVDPATLDPHSLRIRAGTEADVVSTTEDHVRNARHAYYANVSYFDHWVGRLLATLEETGMADSTVVVLTSDHGDMLGDRGNWFKMSFFERSVRVPLILAGAGVGHGVVANPVSHVDLLPTLVDIARANVPPAPLPGDGNSLWEAATGGAHGFHETFSEYTAEMTSHPMFMIRRGDHKYVHCDTDPPLLFDLRADPQERRNLAGDPAHADLAVDFAAEVAERWDTREVRRRVLASQRRRRDVQAAMEIGEMTSWDHSPERDPAQEYVRSHMDWDGAAVRTRFPPIQGSMTSRPGEPT